MAIDLSSLTLSVADNLDQTAAVTVTGAGAGGTVEILRAPWTVQAGARLDWTLATVVTADGAGGGSATVAAAAGFYAWMAVRRASSTTADRISGAVFRPLIDTADPVHVRILDAVVSGLRTLNMSGIGSAADRVFRRWFPAFIPGTAADAAVPVDVGGGALPQVQVAPYPKEIPAGLLTATDDVQYPVLVAFFDAAAETMDNDMPRNLKWRRQAAALFRAQRLAGVPECVVTDWQPDLIVSPDGLAQNYLVGAMTLLVRSREGRGLIP